MTVPRITAELRRAVEEWASQGHRVELTVGQTRIVVSPKAKDDDDLALVNMRAKR